jgi:ABC-type transporter Mla maintaining outer membrane lipid asymmetry permease subunit MlaE
VAVVARELGPVLINLVVIVRSGSAMTTELGVLKISGGVRALETQGSDPFLHLVMPRVLGTALSTFCLTIVFILVAFASGFLRKYVNQTNPPPLRALPAGEEPSRKPVKASSPFKNYEHRR